jgi:hypothetical protein
MQDYFDWSLVRLVHILRVSQIYRLFNNLSHRQHDGANPLVIGQSIHRLSKLLIYGVAECGQIMNGKV